MCLYRLYLTANRIPPTQQPDAIILVVHRHQCDSVNVSSSSRESKTANTQNSDNTQNQFHRSHTECYRQTHSIDLLMLNDDDDGNEKLLCIQQIRITEHFPIDGTERHHFARNLGETTHSQSRLVAGIGQQVFFAFNLLILAPNIIVKNVIF